jgi:hypothetical protein
LVRFDVIQLVNTEGYVEGGGRGEGKRGKGLNKGGGESIVWKANNFHLPTATVGKV